MQLVVPIGYGVWVWCDMTLSIIKLLTVRSWRSDANTVLSFFLFFFHFFIFGICELTGNLWHQWSRDTWFAEYQWPSRRRDLVNGEPQMANSLHQSHMSVNSKRIWERSVFNIMFGYGNSTDRVNVAPHYHPRHHHHHYHHHHRFL